MTAAKKTSVSGLEAYSLDIKQRIAQPLRKHIGGHSKEAMKNVTAAPAANNQKCLVRRVHWNKIHVRQSRSQECEY